MPPVRRTVDKMKEPSTHVGDDNFTTPGWLSYLFEVCIADAFRMLNQSMHDAGWVSYPW